MTDRHERIAWAPNPGPQSLAIRSSADELLFGGKVGGGKTNLLLARAAKYRHTPGYRAVLFRRTKEDLHKPRSLKEGAIAMFLALGGKMHDGGMVWTWPSGARIDLAGLNHEDDKYSWKGTELDFVGFDELVEFTEGQYTYLRSRMRSSISGMRPAVWSTTNPGAEWVLKRWAPWIYPAGHVEYGGIRAEHGERLWYVLDPETEELVPQRERSARGLSRTYIGSSLDDTPQLARTNYRVWLESLDFVSRRMLLHGDWLTRLQKGDMFRREWWSERKGTIVDRHPRPVIARCRYWDLASTPRKPDEKAAPAATASLRLALLDDLRIVVEDCTQDWLTPGGVDDLVLSCAEVDQTRYADEPGGCPTIVEYDPGQAGVHQMWSFATLLAGFTWHHVRPKGNKVERARPVSGEAEKGRVILLRNARWNEKLIGEAGDFPFGLKDIIDALSGGSTWLQARRPVKLPPPGSSPTRIAALGRGGY